MTSQTLYRAKPRNANGCSLRTRNLYTTTKAPYGCRLFLFSRYWGGVHVVSAHFATAEYGVGGDEESCATLRPSGLPQSVSLRFYSGAVQPRSSPVRTIRNWEIRGRAIVLGVFGYRASQNGAVLKAEFAKNRDFVDEGIAGAGPRCVCYLNAPSRAGHV